MAEPSYLTIPHYTLLPHLTIPHYCSLSEHYAEFVPRKRSIDGPNDASRHTLTTMVT